MSKDQEREVVYVDREDGSLKSLLFGAGVGFLLGMLFAPQSGLETRRQLRRRFRKARALAEEKFDELTGRLGDRDESDDEDEDEEEYGEPEEPASVVRADLERRLAAARARRRKARVSHEGDDEEPVA